MNKLQTHEDVIQALRDLRSSMEDYSARMDDPHGDGTGRDNRPPDGDDYNELHWMVAAAIDEILYREKL